MSDNRAKDLTETVFSFLSIKVKLIIIGICLGLLIIFIGIFGLIGVFSSSNSNSDDDGSSSSASSGGSTEVVQGTYKYIGAKFNMPFEMWDSTKDVITSKFSPSRTITVNGVTQTKAHTGMDLVCISKASPKICASLPGKVVVANPGSTGYGNYVVLQHTADDGSIFYTLYGHMIQGSIQVAVGDEVEQGRVLGTMGSTGNSTGPHLHFEVRLGTNSSGSAVNPFPYLFGNSQNKG